MNKRNLSIKNFFNNFHKEFLSAAGNNPNSQLSEFTNVITNELIDAGIIDGFDFCHYHSQDNERVDGYWFDREEKTIDLFIADFNCREDLAELTEQEVQENFTLLRNFFEKCIKSDWHKSIDKTLPEYGFVRQINSDKKSIAKINFYLISERITHTQNTSKSNETVFGYTATYHVWDISRLHQQHNSKGRIETLNIDFKDLFNSAIPCLLAHSEKSSYQTYLLAIPAKILSNLYDLYGSRLLEQNVRCFLQARGKINQGIKATILNEPEMFFAYNNGITATAQDVKTQKSNNGIEIISIKDLQIVNGGQTTASLLHTNKKHGASLEKIFVQMKLSVIPASESENVIPNISQYANTQNRINAADFFSNHPFHQRMEEFSRRIWVPEHITSGERTKWFYERLRGQYADAQGDLTSSNQRRFREEYPRTQMFNKTDMAKFENVWDENPKYVNLGAQKNFAQYALRIGQEWERNSNKFNEFYYKRVISRAILFRRTEKIVSIQPWYNGGYRANIVAYTLAFLAFYCKEENMSIDFQKIWDEQAISDTMEYSIELTAELVHDHIINPKGTISNITEWCKKEHCWDELQKKLGKLNNILSNGFKDELISKEKIEEDLNSAEILQEMDEGIKAQQIIVGISAKEWKKLLAKAQDENLLTSKETGIMKVATQMPGKIPSEKQCVVLLAILKKLEQEGITPN